MDNIAAAEQFIYNLLLDSGMNSVWAQNTTDIISLILLLTVSYLAYAITLNVIKRILIPLFNKSATQFDDLLIKHRFFKRISLLIPALVLYNFTDDTLTNYPQTTDLIVGAVEFFFVIIVILIIDSLLSTLNDYYERFPFSKDHPIKGVVQIIKIILYVAGVLIIVAQLFDKDLSSIILGLGTLSAVMMLIFKDPILGFVGGLQLIFNKMVAIGDWISMPKFGADGNILEINLTTVKVQNWDKTIVTIPTYSLISDSFQNWKGMEVSGGRRIKRAINIDMDSIKFCDNGMLERLKKIALIKDYIEKKQSEIEEHNSKAKIDTQITTNGRRQTNIGIFREYLKRYLSNRSDINMEMTFMVRQLPPSEKGIPMEIYVFSKTTEWVKYEGVQADIFDHVMAAVKDFDLKIYQFPKSGDYATVYSK
ncbi:MAG: mechanosensitive ion channel protein MscS [Marinilabiliales bacterium]|nr:MAG: mechanosensitive ion channel protein MscS [Marinilabiliales bacterium]